MNQNEEITNLRYNEINTKFMKNQFILKHLEFK